MIPIVVSAEPRPENFVPGKYSAIVNVSDSPGLTFTETGLPAFWFPVLETAYWGYAPFFGLANVLDAFRDSGQPVLVHCHGGLNRSPSISYAVLQADGYGDLDIATIAPLLNIPAIFMKNLKKGFIPNDIMRFLQIRKSSPASSIYNLLRTINSPYLTVVVLRRDIPSYVFTLLVLFPAFLTFVYCSSRVLDKFFRTQPARELAHLVASGCLGLIIEWFLIGLSPWSNPDADPILMIGFQLGMFSCWATVGFAPRLFLNTDALSRQSRTAILRFFLPYLALSYLVAYLAPEAMRFGTIISLVVFGYLSLNLFYAKYFLRSFASCSPQGISSKS